MNPTVLRRKSPFAVDRVNTGIVDGALTALSRMNSKAPPPASWAVCGYLAEHRSRGEIRGIGQAGLPSRDSRKLSWQSATTKTCNSEINLTVGVLLRGFFESVTVTCKSNGISSASFERALNH